MYQKMLFTAMMSGLALCAFSESLVKGQVFDSKNSPVAGANVWWLGTTVGATSNEKGEFEIPSVSSTNHLLVSFIGFNTDTIAVLDPVQYQKVLLSGDVQLKEVVINQRKTATINSRTATLQTQKITYDEICRAACCNLAESFETNASVDVSYSDAATGAKQIKLLGLAGTYVQMLTEQIPNLQGAASPYGLGYIPAPWMESIQVSKGTSSVKNGYEALTGQINVEYKKPQSADPLTVNLFGNSAGRMEGNVDGNLRLNDYTSSALMLHYSRDQIKYDENKDGFMDMPTTEQFNGMNRWYYKRDNYMLQVVGNVLHENRESGQMALKGQSLDNPYQIGIKTNRGVLYAKNGYIVNREKNTSFALLLSGTYHNQDSYFGFTQYDVNQKNFYSNLIFETELTPIHKISTGVSFIYDYYKENLAQGNVSGLANLDLHRNQQVGGAYFQYTFVPSDKLTVLAGIRADEHSEHGFFVTPRLHLKLTPFGELLNIRASVGRGFRTANVLVENSYLLASNRKMIFAPNLNTFEAAWNYGASAHFTLPVFSKSLSLMLEYYYTDFQKQVVADLETPGEASFYNLDGRSFAENAQVELSYPFFRGFTLTGAFRWTDAKTTYDGVLKEKPLTNRYKGLLTASYQTRLKKWQFDVTSQFNGKGCIPNPGTEALWASTFPAYVNLNAQVTKYFRTWSVYAGGENLTGYKQKAPVIDAANPWGPDSKFDATMVWGPVHGATFYVGLRWSIPKKDY